jgi:hypothetical protein
MLLEREVYATVLARARTRLMRECFFLLALPFRSFLRRYGKHCRFARN